jgi:anti-sigma-K factor RskA
VNHEEAFLEDVAVYALGALPADQAQKVRAHMNACAICREEHRRLAPAVNALAHDADPSLTPSPLLKRRIMRAIAERPRPNALVYALSAACIVLVAALGAAFAAFGGTQARQAQLIARLTSPQAQHYSVANGEVIRTGSALYIALQHAPPLPPGKVYQAWTLPKGVRRMVPSITFVPRNGSALVRLPVDGRLLAAVALSVEPAGGSKQPTTSPTFVVKFE